MNTQSQKTHQRLKYGLLMAICFFCFFFMGKQTSAASVKTEAELKKALTAAGSQTITLQNNIAVTESISVNGTKTINGGGHNLYKSGNKYEGYLLSVQEKCSLTLNNINVGGNNNSGANNKSLIYMHSGASLTVNNGATLKNNTTKGGVNGGAIWGQGTVKIYGTITGCTVSSSTTSDGNGGAVYLNSGTLSLYNAHITNCTASNSGGAVYVASGTLNVEAHNSNGPHGSKTTLIDNCVAKAGDTGETAGGGAIRVRTGTFTVSSSETALGGRVSVTSNNSTLTSNYTATYRLEIRNCEAKGNNGGAIYVGSDSGSAEMNLRFAYIHDNTAHQGGGGVYIYGNSYNTEADVYKHCVFWSNHAKGQDGSTGGGAICTYGNKTTLEVGNASLTADRNSQHVFFCWNNAGSQDGKIYRASGGAIRANCGNTNGIIHINSGSFVLNSTYGRGGAISIDSGTKTHVSIGTGTVKNHKTVFCKWNDSISDGNAIDFGAGGTIYNVHLEWNGAKTFSGLNNTLWKTTETGDPSGQMDIIAQGQTREVTVSNCYIQGNSGTYAKGMIIRAFNADWGPAVTLSSVEITGNVANQNAADGHKHAGGGILINGKQTRVTFQSNVKIHDNKVTGNYNGGGVAVKGGSLTITNNNNEIYQNTSEYHGGGVFVESGAVLTAASLNVHDNTAKSHGGGLANEGTSNITGCSITNNQVAGGSSVAGGGIHNAGSGTLSLYQGGNNISNNTSANHGGGLYNASNGRVVIENTGTDTISGNVASNYGGGIFNDGIMEYRSTKNYTGAVLLNIRDNKSNITNNGGAGGGGLYNTGSFKAVSTTDGYAWGNANQTHTIDITGNTDANANGRAGGIDNNGGSISIGNLWVLRVYDNHIEETIPAVKNENGGTMTLYLMNGAEINGADGGYAITNTGANTRMNLYTPLNQSGGTVAITSSGTYTVNNTDSAALNFYDAAGSGKLYVYNEGAATGCSIINNASGAVLDIGSTQTVLCPSSGAGNVIKYGIENSASISRYSAVITSNGTHKIQTGIHNAKGGTVVSCGGRVENCTQYGFFNEGTLNTIQTTISSSGADGVRNTGTITVCAAKISDSTGNGIYNEGTIQSCQGTIQDSGKYGIDNHISADNKVGKIGVCSAIIADTKQDGIYNAGTMTEMTGRVSDSGSIGIENVHLQSLTGAGTINTLSGTVSGFGTKGIQNADSAIITVCGPTVTNSGSSALSGVGIYNQGSITTCSATVKYCTTGVTNLNMIHNLSAAITKCNYGLLNGFSSASTVSSAAKSVIGTGVGDLGIDQADISNNTHAGIKNAGTIANISNSNIEGNGQKTDNGTGIYAQGSLSKTVLGAETLISYNVSKNGTIYLTGNASVTMNDSDVRNNDAVNGGGVYIASGIFTMNEGWIGYNYAENGGGIYIDKASTAVMHHAGGWISSNNALGKGTAVFIDGTSENARGHYQVEKDAKVRIDNDIYENPYTYVEVTGDFTGTNREQFLVTPSGINDPTVADSKNSTDVGRIIANNEFESNDAEPYATVDGEYPLHGSGAYSITVTPYFGRGNEKGSSANPIDVSDLDYYWAKVTAIQGYPSPQFHLLDAGRNEIYSCGFDDLYSGFDDAVYINTAGASYLYFDGARNSSDSYTLSVSAGTQWIDVTNYNTLTINNCMALYKEIKSSEWGFTGVRIGNDNPKATLREGRYFQESTLIPVDLLTHDANDKITIDVSEYAYIIPTFRGQSVNVEYTLSDRITSGTINVKYQGIRKTSQECFGTDIMIDGKGYQYIVPQLPTADASAADTIHYTLYDENQIKVGNSKTAASGEHISFSGARYIAFEYHGTAYTINWTLGRSSQISERLLYAQGSAEEERNGKPVMKRFIVDSQTYTVRPSDHLETDGKKKLFTSAVNQKNSNENDPNYQKVTTRLKATNNHSSDAAMYLSTKYTIRYHPNLNDPTASVTNMPGANSYDETPGTVSATKPAWSSGTAEGYTEYIDVKDYDCLDAVLANYTTQGSIGVVMRVATYKEVTGGYSQITSYQFKKSQGIDGDIHSITELSLKGVDAIRFQFVTATYGNSVNFTIDYTLKKANGIYEEYTFWNEYYTISDKKPEATTTRATRTYTLDETLTWNKYANPSKEKADIYNQNNGNSRIIGGGTEFDEYGIFNLYAQWDTNFKRVAVNICHYVMDETGQYQTYPVAVTQKENEYTDLGVRYTIQVPLEQEITDEYIAMIPGGGIEPRYNDEGYTKFDHMDISGTDSSGRPKDPEAHTGTTTIAYYYSRNRYQVHIKGDIGMRSVGLSNDKDCYLEGNQLQKKRVYQSYPENTYYDDPALDQGPVETAISYYASRNGTDIQALDLIIKNNTEFKGLYRCGGADYTHYDSDVIVTKQDSAQTYRSADALKVNTGDVYLYAETLRSGHVDVHYFLEERNADGYQEINSMRQSVMVKDFTLRNVSTDVYRTATLDKTSRKTDYIDVSAMAELKVSASQKVTATLYDQSKKEIRKISVIDQGKPGDLYRTIGVPDASYVTFQADAAVSSEAYVSYIGQNATKLDWKDGYLSRGFTHSEMIDVSNYNTLYITTGETLCVTLYDQNKKSIKTVNVAKDTALGTVDVTEAAYADYYMYASATLNVKYALANVRSPENALDWKSGSLNSGFSHSPMVDVSGYNTFYITTGETLCVTLYDQNKKSIRSINVAKDMALGTVDVTEAAYVDYYMYASATLNVKYALDNVQDFAVTEAKGQTKLNHVTVNGNVVSDTDWTHLTEGSVINIYLDRERYHLRLVAGNGINSVSSKAATQSTAKTCKHRYEVACDGDNVQEYKARLTAASLYGLGTPESRAQYTLSTAKNTGVKCSWFDRTDAYPEAYNEDFCDEIAHTQTAMSDATNTSTYQADNQDTVLLATQVYRYATVRIEHYRQQKDSEQYATTPYSSVTYQKPNVIVGQTSYVISEHQDTLATDSEYQLDYVVVDGTTYHSGELDGVELTAGEERLYIIKYYYKLKDFPLEIHTDGSFSSVKVTVHAEDRKVKVNNVSYQAKGSDGSILEPCFEYKVRQNFTIQFQPVLDNTALKAGHHYGASYYTLNQDSTTNMLDSTGTGTYSITGTIEELQNIVSSNGTLKIYLGCSQEPNSYLVQYNINAPEGAVSARGSYTMDNVAYGEDYTVAQNPRIKDGQEEFFAIDNYRFLGWLSEEDYKAGQSTPTYYPGDSAVNLTEENGKTVNLYAVWRDRALDMPHIHTVNKFFEVGERITESNLFEDFYIGSSDGIAIDRRIAGLEIVGIERMIGETRTRIYPASGTIAGDVKDMTPLPSGEISDYLTTDYAKKYLVTVRAHDFDTEGNIGEYATAVFKITVWEAKATTRFVRAIDRFSLNTIPADSKWAGGELNAEMIMSMRKSGYSQAKYIYRLETDDISNIRTKYAQNAYNWTDIRSWFTSAITPIIRS